ncbi:methyltransferase [Fulvimarina sp. 2208YS6-2-32]|uniref:Methyltransferase n=1 Tax=Fulvimarina uroteuthidis TaxID=3098149 RepID=A0ABU5I064_9HYPH|nr:methyltransferase [Fulvimarina sp. 2208YS6-2-32]MDY8107556.1 methyltransferase [Fulvimarina sp. 2208YS6-2-32]
MTSFDEDELGEAYVTGLEAEKRGDIASAAAAYRRCLEIDPADHVGATIRLAGMGEGEAPASAGHAYVATLFDQHAESFEDILVRQLRYGVPEQLADRLKSGGASYGHVLDLGCGTGLAGQYLEAVADRLTGVDLSEEMIRISGEKDIYDKLYVAEAVGFLQKHEEPPVYDLIVATDVLPYLGDLDPFFSSLAKRLSPGGLVGFSTETMDDAMLAGRAFAVGKAQRFHHGEAYVRDRLSVFGFSIEHFEAITVRMQDGLPAPGHLVVARKG